MFLCIDGNYLFSVNTKMAKNIVEVDPGKYDLMLPFKIHIIDYNILINCNNNNHNNNLIISLL